MSDRLVGILGCAALLGAVGISLVVVGFERSLVAAGFPYQFTGYSIMAFGLCASAFGLGFAVRRTRPGKVALIGGSVLGGLFACYVLLVLVAFRTGA